MENFGYGITLFIEVIADNYGYKINNIDSKNGRIYKIELVDKEITNPTKKLGIEFLDMSSNKIIIYCSDMDEENEYPTNLLETEMLCEIAEAVKYRYK